MSGSRRKQKDNGADKPRLPIFDRILVGLAGSWLNKKARKMKGSYKTTLAGVGVLLSAIGLNMTALFDNNPATTLDLDAIVMALAGLGLLFARDNDVTSKDAGAE